MKALIIGATGATGRDLVNVLLKDSYYTQVIIFVRRSIEISHPKLSEIITDFDKLEDVADLIKGDLCFSCLGTTQKAAGSKEKQLHIDYEIPLKFVEIAKRNNVQKIVLLSAYGASTSSNIFYSKIKGQLEEGVSKLGFDQYIIFRPGMLQRPNTDRTGERVINSTLNFLNSLGLIKKFKPLPTAILAEKMSKSVKVLSYGKHSLELDQIFTF